jgi:hypothetical protein
MKSAIALAAICLLASPLLAHVPVGDGQYKSDGGLPSNDGTVSSTNGGDDLSFVSGGGSGSLYTWDGNKSVYEKDPTGDIYVVVEAVLDAQQKPIQGEYTWTAYWTVGGAGIDSGTLSKTN